MDSSRRSCPLACGAGYTLRDGAYIRLPRGAHTRSAWRFLLPGLPAREALLEAWNEARRRSFAAAPGQPFATRRPLNAARRPCAARARQHGLGWRRPGKTFWECFPLDSPRLRDCVAGRSSASGKVALLRTGGAHNAWRKGLPDMPERPRARPPHDLSRTPNSSRRQTRGTH